MSLQQCWYKSLNTSRGVSWSFDAGSVCYCRSWIWQVRKPNNSWVKHEDVALHCQVEFNLDSCNSLEYRRIDFDERIFPELVCSCWQLQKRPRPQLHLVNSIAGDGRSCHHCHLKSLGLISHGSWSNKKTTAVWQLSSTFRPCHWQSPTRWQHESWLPWIRLTGGRYSKTCKQTRPCFAFLGGEDKWLQSQLEITRTVIFVEVCYTFDSGFSSLHQVSQGDDQDDVNTIDWPKTSVFWDSYWFLFHAGWFYQSHQHGMRCFQITAPELPAWQRTYVKYIVVQLQVLPEVGESFPYHYQNHYQKQWASDLQHTNQGTNQVCKCGIEPPIFLTFLGECLGQWRLMSGLPGSMFRESKWSEFFSKPWRWKMPLSSCT